MMSRLILKICFDRFKSLPRDENGAALMITLAVALFLYLLCSASYAIGATVNEKIQLQNACDAAAYSAAVVEADALSRIATINRAMSWTYIQIVRRRMDYIMLEWLNLVKKNFEEDRQKCFDFNSKPYNIAQDEVIQERHVFIPASCEHHTSSSINDPGPGKWFCGWTENDDIIRLGYVTKDEMKTQSTDDAFQYGRFLSYKDLVKNLKGYQPSEWKSQMDRDRDILDNLTALLVGKIRSTNEQMEKAALEILRKNLSPVNGGEYYYRIQLPNFVYPYPNEDENKEDKNMRGIFSPYRNTEEDELEFLAASLGGAASSLQDIFGDGIDQWFIRGSEAFLKLDVNNETEKTLNVDDDNKSNYISRGIQRGYKSANRKEPASMVTYLRGNHVKWGNSLKYTEFGAKALDVFKLFRFLSSVAGPDLSNSINCVGAAKKDDDIKPSCLNSNNLFIEQCTEIKNNFGLVAEYHWSALRWWCGLHFIFYLDLEDGDWDIPDPQNSIEEQYHVHYKMASITECKCEHMTQGIGSKTREEYMPCYVGADMMHDGTHGATNGASGYMTMGYTRIYGDDSHIWNADYYITPKVMPVKLNHEFFQERINVAVGKKFKNPFHWFFSDGGQSAVAPRRSIYAIFNPVSNMIAATSSATAAFRSRRQGEGHYETNYDQVTSFEFDSKFGEDTATIKLANNVDQPSSGLDTVYEKLRMGCPHKIGGNKIAERLNKVWNLCEPDWQAVFVPHRYADNNWIGHRIGEDGTFQPFDSMVSGEVCYRPYPRELDVDSNFMMSLSSLGMRPLHEDGDRIILDIKYPVTVSGGKENYHTYSQAELMLYLLYYKLQ